jgi:hypothetical protein
LRVALLYKRHAQPDEEVLKWLDQELTARGYTVFVDRRLDIGVEWSREIERQIGEADAVVPLLSAASVSSEMLAWEVELAHYQARRSSGKPRLLPVRLNCEGDLPPELASVLNRVSHCTWGSFQDNPRLLAELLAALQAPPPRPPKPPAGAIPLSDATGGLPRDVPRGPDPAELAGETGEQFPSLIDQTRLAATAVEQPKLVSGLAAVVLKHADSADVEQELLSRAECYNFRGTIEQRLMEFLYLGEKNLRLALGPALFKAKDLRRIAAELGADCELARDPEQLSNLILRALCFNLLADPVGLTQYMARVERLILDLEGPDTTEANRIASAVEAAKVLEQVLKDILRLYGFYLFGTSFEQELVQNHVIPARRDGGVTRLTLGQARDALVHLGALIKKDPKFCDLLARLGRNTWTLLPTLLIPEQTEKAIDCNKVLTGFIRWRNQEIVHDDPSAPAAPDQRAVQEQLGLLRTFLLACRAEGIYPEVLRYEGTFENRNGERFVHFLDERHAERRVRTDEKIDPRRHYYCFATNNPLHLFPVLVPKL